MFAFTFHMFQRAAEVASLSLQGRQELLLKGIQTVTWSTPSTDKFQSSTSNSSPEDQSSIILVFTAPVGTIIPKYLVPYHWTSLH